MKFFTKVISVIAIMAVLASCFAMSAFAYTPYPEGVAPTKSSPGNPYGIWQTITFNGVTATTVRCTWYAWEMFYQAHGEQPPNWGNGGQWYANAKKSGWPVGTTPKPGALAVYDGETAYGHVAFVNSISADGKTMYLFEGGMLGSNGYGYKTYGIYNYSPCNTVVGGRKSVYSSKTLTGFIYPKSSTATTTTTTKKIDPTVVESTSAVSVTDTNASLKAAVNKNKGDAVTKIMLRMGKKSGGEYTMTEYQIPSSTYEDNTVMYMTYDLTDEFGWKLTPGTEYIYQYGAVVAGSTVWSKQYTLKTTGTAGTSSTTTKTTTTTTKTTAKTTAKTTTKNTTAKTTAQTTANNKHTHEFGDWKTVKEVTCSENGKMTRTCDCGLVESQTIVSIGHTYGAWKVVKEATVDSTGLEEQTCRCGAKITQEIAKLAADGHTHKFGSWEVVSKASCEKNGERQRSCSVCGETESSTIAARGHNYRDWTVTVEATESVPGTEEQTCAHCGDKQERYVDINGIVLDDTYVDDTYDENELDGDEPSDDALNDDATDDEGDNAGGWLQDSGVPLWIWIVLGVILLGTVVLLIIALLPKKKNKEEAVTEELPEVPTDEPPLSE